MNKTFKNCFLCELWGSQLLFSIYFELHMFRNNLGVGGQPHVFQKLEGTDNAHYSELSLICHSTND